MSSEQKRGFRLPWSADRSTDEGAGATTLEVDSVVPTPPEEIEDAVGDELGEGPFHLADGVTPESSMDAAPEASEVPETTAEAAMIDTETATTEPAEAAPAATDTDAWTTVDDQAVTNEAVTEPEAAPEPKRVPPAIHVDSDTPVTRSNPLVAGLVKAMREAAVASRAETTSRLQAEATARVEEIRSTATEEGAALRKRVDEDVAAIRDWSKGEMARIRHETEERIETRRTEAIVETERHTAHIEKVVEQVQSRVDAFEADMDRFFERLLAENDPARVAALAEQAPEPPDLAVELAEPVAQATVGAYGYEAEPGATDADAPDASAWNDVAWTTAHEPGAAIELGAGLEPGAAAEAEAAASEGLDMSSTEEWPATVVSAARRPDFPATEFEPAGVANARLFVHGLTSVAGISSFKGALGQLPGVRSVSVSSGEPGVFIFTVVHSPETDLTAEVSGLTNFSAIVSEVTSEGLTVLAHEPD